MLDTILNILKPETFVLVLLGLIPLLLLAAKYPEVVWAFGFPILLFIGELKDLIPISASALCGIFPLIAIAGGMFKGYRFRFGRIEKAFVLLVGLMCFSLRYSHSPVYGTEKVVLLLGTSLPLVLAASYTLVSFETLRRALSIISLSLVIYIIVSVTVKLSGAELPVGDRFGGIQGPIMAGRCFGLSAIVYFYWWFPRETAWKVWGYFVVAGAVLLAFFTGTRTSVAGLFGTVLAVQYLREKAFFRSFLKKAGRSYFLLIAVFVFDMFGPSLLSTVLPQSLYEKRFSSWEYFTYSGDFKQPTSRVLTTVVAWEAFLESPLLGLGAGGYKNALWDFGHRSIFYFDPRHAAYPHNIFLEFLAEQGIFGLMLFCYMMYHAFRILFDVRVRLPGLSGLQKRMVIVVVAFFIYGLLVAQTSLDIPKQYILWWGLGMLISLPHIWETPTQPRRNAKATHKSIPNPMLLQPNPSKLRRQSRRVFLKGA
jgi:O-antigen ligase